MGCASCGQRYNRTRVPASSPEAKIRRSQIAARRAYIRKSLQGVIAVASPDETKREVVVQPDVPAGVPIPPCKDEVEPATGISLAVIKGGEDPSKSLGDTLVPPVTVVDGLGQGD